MREQIKMHWLKNTGNTSETNHKGIHAYLGTIETAVNTEKWTEYGKTLKAIINP